MTSLLTIVSWAAICGLFFFVRAIIKDLKPSAKGYSVCYLLMITFLLGVDHYLITPAYNIVNVDWAVVSNADYHANYRNTVMSYVNSSKWNEFRGQRIQKKAVDQLLSDLRGTTKESSEEVYSKLVCYMDKTFNSYDTHARATVDCFSNTLNGSDAGLIRMWTSIIVDGTSRIKTMEFKVYVKPSIIQQAMHDVEATLTRWEEEDAALDAYNAKQDELRNRCMDIWNRPMGETSERFSLRWLHEHCNDKHPSAWTVEDIK